jgi:hypothetical protein
MTRTNGGPAIVATGLIKEFDRGRRTTWQRLRREPDLLVFLRTEHRIRVRDTTGQH